MLYSTVYALYAVHVFENFRNKTSIDSFEGKKHCSITTFICKPFNKVNFRNLK